MKIISHSELDTSMTTSLITLQFWSHQTIEKLSLKSILTGKRKSNAFRAAWRTALVGYIGPPGDVKLYKQVFNLVLVVILSSKPAKINQPHWWEKQPKKSNQKYLRPHRWLKKIPWRALICER